MSTEDLVTALTRVVRESDEVFERVGGSSRHWVRDCFLPILRAAGLEITRQAENAALLMARRDDGINVVGDPWVSPLSDALAALDNAGEAR